MENDLCFEFGPTGRGLQCACCGKESITAHGFVYSGDEPFAVYFAGWVPEHPEQGVTMAIAIGKWDERSTADDRAAVGVDAFPNGNEIQFAVLDAERSPWSETELFGRLLSRQEALQHPQLPAILAVAESIVRSDPRVRRVLERISTMQKDRKV